MTNPTPEEVDYEALCERFNLIPTAALDPETHDMIQVVEWHQVAAMLAALSTQPEPPTEKEGALSA